MILKEQPRSKKDNRTAEELQQYKNDYMDGWMQCIEELINLRALSDLEKLPVEGKVN